MSRSMQPLSLGQYGAGNPVIVAEFSDRWRTQGYHKRASVTWLRKLKAAGVTWVTLDIEGRTPDFRVDELLDLNRRD